jgi:hypothetical protein
VPLIDKAAERVHHITMSEAFRHMVLGLSAVFFAPSGCLSGPQASITIPPSSAQEALAFDFSRISSDLNRAVDKVQNQKQLEMEFTSDRPKV